ncbi:DNA-binding protein RFX2-like isoform X1 [Montipora capricornis]|uniref:DNA-binding protein RFX2-like isoform X1 n=2 Tax=Montipora capricornis TaxID=246305 RepID=UPI0035F16D52
METLQELLDFDLDFFDMNPRFPVIKKEERKDCLFDVEDVMYLSSNIPQNARFFKSELSGPSSCSGVPPYIPSLSSSASPRLSHLDHSFYYRRMATTQPQQNFVAQNFDSGEVKSQAAATNNVVSSPQDFTQQVVSAASAISHGIVVSSQNVPPSPHQTTLPVNAVTLTVQPAQLQAPQATLQPQIITASVISSDEFQAKEGFPTAEVHFVEAPSDHTIYPNGTGGNAYYNDATMFAQQATAPYLDAGQQQQNFAAATTQGAVSSGQTGYIQVTPAGTAMQAQRHPITHTTRASPATVQWLVDNYETAEVVSLPRSTLYNHYLQHCQANKLDAVNAASFGKLIRSVFMGLRTRRLGTRGNSKYHYYGIRIKPSSPLNALSEESQVAMRQSPSTQKRLKPAARLDSTDAGESASQSPAVSADQQAQQAQMQQHQQYLGDVTQGLPEFDELDLKDVPVPEGITDQDLDTFVDMYREHCEAFLDVVVNLQFTVVESLWQTFWRHSAADNKTGQGEDQDGQKDAGDDGEYESRLSQSKLLQLCEYDPIITFVKACDQLLYQTLVEVLIPDVLRPIPASLTQAVRNFAKGLESWLVKSLDQIPKKMADVKISSCGAFAQTLRRYTSLNHLAQAARAVLQNSSQISQMLADLNRVDFANVQEQASWVCQCDDNMVYRLEQDFKLTLQQQNSLEQWATWLEGVVDQVLKEHEGTEEFPKAARQFLLKWSFYSSMIIRDLTLRSAASFGSFHLIRLLYDEYMFYLVEHKVAKAIGASPMAVMGEFVGLGSAFSMGLDTVDGSLLTDQPDLTYGSSASSAAISTSIHPSGTGSLEPEAKRPRPS